MTALQGLHVGDSCKTEAITISEALKVMSSVLRNLTALTLSRTCESASLISSLVQLSDLQQLHIPSVGLTSADLSVLCQALTGLTALDVSRNPSAFPEDGCRHLPCLQQLQYLLMNECWYHDSWPVSRSAQQRLGSMLASQCQHLHELSTWSFQRLAAGDLPVWSTRILVGLCLVPVTTCKPPCQVEDIVPRLCGEC